MLVHTMIARLAMVTIRLYVVYPMRLIIDTVSVCAHAHTVKWSTAATPDVRLQVSTVTLISSKTNIAYPMTYVQMIFKAYIVHVRI